jgi:hypothetical protein
LIQANVDGSALQEIATGKPPGIFGVNADAQQVYYFTNLNQVFALPVGGGSAKALSGGPYNSFIVDMKLQGSQLYWTNTGVTQFEETQPETAGVISAAVSGETSATSLVTRLDFPLFKVAVTEQSVFWSDDKSIYRTSLLGGAYSSIAPLDSAPPDESPIVEVLGDANYVFYANDHAIYRVPVQGGAPELVTDGWRSIGHMTADESNLYFTDNAAASVVKIAKCATGAPSGLGAIAEDQEPVPTVPADPGADAGCTGSHGCVDPTPVATATLPYGLALDEDYVYVSEFSSSGRILRLPLAGGALEVIASSQKQPHDIAVAGDRVFWCLNDGHVVGDLKTGGATKTLATGFGGTVARVTSDGVFAYFVTGYSGIYRVPVTGGEMSAVAAGPYTSSATDLLVLNDEVYWTNDGKYNITTSPSTPIPNTGFIAKAHVVGTPTINRTTLIYPLNNPSLLVPSSSATHRIASDGTFLYYTDAVNVYRAHRDGSHVQQLGPVSPASGRIYDLEVSDGYVYFVDKNGLYRIPTSGGETQPLSTGWSYLISIAVNKTDIYFTDAVGGKVLRLPK